MAPFSNQPQRLDDGAAGAAVAAVRADNVDYDAEPAVAHDAEPVPTVAATKNFGEA